MDPTLRTTAVYHKDVEEQKSLLAGDLSNRADIYFIK